MLYSRPADVLGTRFATKCVNDLKTNFSFDCSAGKNACNRFAVDKSDSNW